MSRLIAPYNPNWKIEFDHLKATLLESLKEYTLDIQHVGSTAIPNLIAKPILDIDIIIDNKNLVKEITKQLEKRGYLSKGDQGITGRFAFRQTAESTPETKEQRKWQEHHLYVCYADSVALKNHLLFRDALLHDNGLVEQYASLKRKLTSDNYTTRNQYNKHKTDFILAVLAKAGCNESELNEILKANS